MMSLGQFSARTSIRHPQAPAPQRSNGRYRLPRASKDDGPYGGRSSFEARKGSRLRMTEIGSALLQPKLTALTANGAAMLCSVSGVAIVARHANIRPRST